MYKGSLYQQIESVSQLESSKSLVIMKNNIVSTIDG